MRCRTELGDQLCVAMSTSGLQMNGKEQLEEMYAAVLDHRALSCAISVLIMILCLSYIAWEPVKDYLLAWMRWHLWAYPA